MTKASAESTTIACSTAVSWLPTACSVSPPRPLQAEHRLGDDGAGQQLAEQHAGDGERRQQRVARHMPPQHPAARGALGAGDGDEGLRSAPRRCCASGSAPAAPRSGWRG